MIEKILGAGFFIGVVIRDIFGLYKYDQGILIFGTFLAILYLFANWWINKPTETTFRTVSITVLYGITFSCLTFTLLFKLLFLSGSDQMTVLSGILIIVTLSFDFLSSLNKTRVINKKTIVRFSILVPLVVVNFLINEEKRIRFTYRQNPDFLKFYEENKDNYDSFYDLQKDY